MRYVRGLWRAFLKESGSEDRVWPPLISDHAFRSDCSFADGAPLLSYTYSVFFREGGGGVSKRWCCRPNRRETRRNCIQVRQIAGVRTPPTACRHSGKKSSICGSGFKYTHAPYFVCRHATYVISLSRRVAGATPRYRRSNHTIFRLKRFFLHRNPAYPPLLHLFIQRVCQPPSSRRSKIVRKVHTKLYMRGLRVRFPSQFPLLAWLL